MKYQQIEEARFLDRPNRFIAHVLPEGRETEEALTVHVKNTGRCTELLVPGAKVYLERSSNPNRSTAYDLVAVEKGGRLINMDSQAPNKAVAEWLLTKELFPDLLFVKPEKVFGESRFDFYIETVHEKIFLEVKGVTREISNAVCFPDAPSQRAIKHLEELVQALRQGYRACVLFVIQMEDVDYFVPDVERHEDFVKALQQAKREGVEIFAYDCRVKPDGMEIGKPVEVRLDLENTIFKEKLKKTLRFGALEDIPKPLLKWYDKGHRILPWRQQPTPYRVWVSEIMLQQTRVEAVKPYFERFMRELPTIRNLAEVEEEKLLKLWEGLGYYNRARNLQRAAQQIVEQYGGEMPGDYDALLALSGIGSYTAGAIASIAFGIARPAVDGNVLRVLARYREDERCITDGKVKSAVEAELQGVMPLDRPGDFNQAMMELGACVCLPNGEPHCPECPLAESCKAHKSDGWKRYPVKAEKKPRTIEERTILLVRDAEKVALCKRGAKGLLAGLYEFPSLDGYRSAREVVSHLENNGFHVLRITPLCDAKHIFSHREWHMKGFMVRVDELERENPGEDVKGWVFIEPHETREKYPIPSAFEAYSAYLNMILGKNGWKE